MSDASPSDSSKDGQCVGRGKPSSEGRFIWLASLAVERIVNELGATQAAFGIAVYVALCRLSSKAKNDPRIQIEIAKVAGDARLSYRKTADILDALERQAKVIAIQPGQRSKGSIKQPASIYTLLALSRHNKPSRSRHNKPSPDGTRVTTSYADIPKETTSVVETESSASTTELPSTSLCSETSLRSSSAAARASARRASEASDESPTMIGSF